MRVVQNYQPDMADIQPVIDEQIVETVHQIFDAVTAKRHETVRNYLANLNSDERTKLAYGLVREKTTEIADAVLSTIGQEVNRGAVINAQAVQANSKNKEYNEILLRMTKTSGDITIPTDVIVISTNCVDMIKASCQKEKEPDQEKEAEKDAGEKSDKQKQAVADKPAKVGKGKKTEK